MDLLIVSDTHGRRDRLLEVFGRAPFAAVLFLGDGLRDLDVLPSDTTVRAVRGNCDFTGADTPTARVEDFGICRIFMTHGHTCGVKWSPERAIAAAVEAGADVLLYGHTHTPLERTLPAGSVVAGAVTTKPLLILNPGSLGDPREGDPSFATLTLRGGIPLAGFGKIK